MLQHIIKSPAKEMLLNSIERPSSEQVMEMDEAEIINIAEGLGYEIYPQTIGRICLVHEAFMPVIENGLISMLSETEKDKPDYYAFARDGELFYDALWGIGKAGEDNIQERTHYLKTSLGMKDDENNSKYLEEMGITKKRFKKGRQMVFLDSGFRGSLFHKVAKWAGHEEYGRHTNLRSFLMKKGTGSFFEEIDLTLNLPNKIDKEKIKKIIQTSPYWGEVGEDLNRMTCAFMQMMPKFTGRFVQTYQKENGSWDVLPEQNSLISKLNHKRKDYYNQSKSSRQINSLDSQVNHINADIVNPLASLLLQKRTLDYFTDPNVHERVYSALKK